MSQSAHMYNHLAELNAGSISEASPWVGRGYHLIVAAGGGVRVWARSIVNESEVAGYRLREIEGEETAQDGDHGSKVKAAV